MAFTTTTGTTRHRTTRRKPRPRRSGSTLALIGTADGAANAPGAGEQSAAELLADLAALVDAGLIAPVEQHGVVRYAVIDPDGAAA
jgi:hypothetical protein